MEMPSVIGSVAGVVANILVPLPGEFNHSINHHVLTKYDVSQGCYYEIKLLISVVEIKCNIGLNIIQKTK